MPVILLLPAESIELAVLQAVISIWGMSRRIQANSCIDW